MSIIKWWDNVGGVDFLHCAPQHGTVLPAFTPCFSEEKQQKTFMLRRCGQVPAMASIVEAAGT
jgi:hypothetical protein